MWVYYSINNKDKTANYQVSDISEGLLLVYYTSNMLADINFSSNKLYGRTYLYLHINLT